MGPRSKLALAGAAAALAGGIALWALPGADGGHAKPPLGLFTSLPIYWAESASVTEALNSEAAPHWARTALEAGNRLVPLDTLDGAELNGLDRLVLAQPRPLAPAENVALDDWVRSGGRLLLFADPMLTEHSRFALGDKRRPQDVVVLSPILRRWGIELEFDEDQPADERAVRVGGEAIPVRLAGAMRLIEPGAPAQCKIESGSLVARCRVGQGHALVIADAAMLESDRGEQAGAGLTKVLEAAFPR